ncbi:glycosyltransferase family 4 protein [Granulicella tundricola]|uniref:glycosyltransferase family 4 protein n=1 Tax=Granulicella tundricola TaxID=940615 RepID=UPI0018DCAEBC|nr:glycosyltransferase family 4 protein [Granulicella tundricola]
MNVTVDLAAEQARNGHTVVIVAGHGEYAALLPKLGIEYFFLDQRVSAVNLVKASVLLFRKIKAFRPDIIHAHMRTSLLLAWLCTRFPRYPLVAHLHNVHDPESALMRVADRVIAVSQSVSETMARTIPKWKLRVVLNGPLQSARTAPFTSIPPRMLIRPAITTVAGLNHRKGIADLLEAFDLVLLRVPNAQLYLVGDGPERVLFEAQAKLSPHCDQIHFEGWQAEPQGYLMMTDVFVLASRRDSLGLVLLEAREAGCAIVATHVDGIPEALDGGTAGILVPAKNPSYLADTISNLLLDPALKQTWQKNAQKGIENFTCARMTVKVQEIYDELIESLHR